MVRVIIIISMFLISSCTSNREVQGRIELPKILAIDGEKFAAIPSIESNELKISRPKDNHLAVKFLNQEAPEVEVRGFYCNNIDYGAELLKNADLLFELSHVREEWVPIDGKPKKIYIFDVRFNK